MKNKEEIWTQMARYISGEMEMKEEIEFRSAIENKPVLLKDLEQMEKSWKHINENPVAGKEDTGDAWNKLNQRLASDGLLEDTNSPKRSGRFTPALKIAASIIVILAVAIPSIWYGLDRSDEGPAELKRFSEKGIKTIDLPDGSRVFLNEGSEITYPENFEAKRAIKLEGEAFFEVMSDPANPFIVRSGHVMVSVLGTSFNVKKAAEDPGIEVFVETGKVRMALESNKEFITLEPGELGRADELELSHSIQSDHNYISWKTKDFKFVDEELGKVLRELEESYHVEIFAEDIQLGELRITSTYREQSIDSILETIAAAFGLKVQKKEELFYLNP